MNIENYEIEKIGDASWSIQDGMVRAFLFAGNKGAILVDTGVGSGNIKDVVDKLTDLPVTLINTHADEDHIGCNSLFEKAYMHPAEFAYYAEKAPADAAAPAAVQDCEIIDLCGRQFKVLLLPGHTQGSIALLDLTNRFLVAGDSISSNPIFMFGRMRNLHAFIASMERLIEFDDQYDMIYASHAILKVDKSQIDNQILCANKYLKGELEAQEPPFDIPAKMYKSDGAGFYLSED